MAFKTYDFLLGDLFNPFDFDKSFYKFNRDEKDMYPYTIHNDKEKNIITITHNVLGLNKEDIKLARKVEKGVSYIVISGSTVDDVTGKTYTVDSRFSVDEDVLDLSKATSTAKNGLLYIKIPYKKVEKREEQSFIKID